MSKSALTPMKLPLALMKLLPIDIVNCSLISPGHDGRQLAVMLSFLSTEPRALKAVRLLII